MTIVSTLAFRSQPSSTLFLTLLALGRRRAEGLLLLAAALCLASACDPVPRGDVATTLATHDDASGSTGSSNREASAVLDTARRVVAGDAEWSKRLTPQVTASAGWRTQDDGVVSPGWIPRPERSRAELAARAPERADGSWEITLERTEQYGLSVEWADAAPVDAEALEGALVYRGVHPGTDAIVTSTTSYVEVSYVLDGPNAPREWTWQIETGPGIAGARESADGGLYLVRADGRAVWNVPAAYAIDATGKRHELTTEWLGTGLRFSLHSAIEAWPVVVDPIMTALFWVQRQPDVSPAARKSHAMVYDAQRNKTVLFGGSGDNGFRHDTWEWDGTNWTELNPATRPRFRHGHAMVYDSARQRTVLFGGNNDVRFNDTWEWDGTNWTELNPLTSPSARSSHAMAYDSARQRTVLFGGSTGNDDLDDMWEWDGTNWSELNLLTKELERHGHAMAYDSERQRTVTFGGYSLALAHLQIQYIDFTSEWDGTNWSSLLMVNRPSGRRGHAMAYDSERQRTVLLGGYDGNELDDTWEWDGTTWSQLNLESWSQSYQAMVYDAQRRMVVAFGRSGTWELGMFSVQGSECTDDAECASDFCVDGSCCDQKCDLPCDVCNGATLPGLGVRNGQCTPVPANAAACGAYLCNSVSECPVTCTVDAECVANGFCASGNACRYDTDSCGSDDTLCRAAEYCANGECVPIDKNGTPCISATHCESGFCVDGFCSGCGADVACAASMWCSSGTCVPDDTNGTPCTAPEHCASGFCKDGVCCDSDCGGTCNACSVMLKGQGSDGICEPIPMRQDPDNECKVDATRPDDCVVDPYCNGASACTCPRQVCGEDRHTVISTSRERDCSPYRCDEGECKTECWSGADCIRGALCNAQGECVIEDQTAAVSKKSGGCQTAPGRGSSSGLVVGLLALFLVGRLSRRARHELAGRLP